MNTYQIQRRILALEGLTFTERLVGMVFALHLNRKSGQIRVRQEVIAQECQCKERVVRNALVKLESAGIFSSKRTGRATVLRVLEDTGKKSVIVERHQRADQTGTTVPIRKRKTNCFQLDTELSTRAEENAKRKEKLFLLNQDVKK